MTFPARRGRRCWRATARPSMRPWCGALPRAGMWVTLNRLNFTTSLRWVPPTNSTFFGQFTNPGTPRVPESGSSGAAPPLDGRRLTRPPPAHQRNSIDSPRLCGITGIKPTLRRANRYGMIAFASSLSTKAGPMARSEDCALLRRLRGPDPDRDSTSLDVPADFTTTSARVARACASAY